MYEKYMLEALKEAKKAYKIGEIPVGAVLVYENQIIARAHNTRITDNCVLGHAEINVIRQANSLLQNWRLENAILYVTLLPCPMCASAINQARIKRVICGTVPNNYDYDLIYRILSDHNYGSSVEIMTAVLEDDCSSLLKKFFLEKRG